jgi:hypothetical protein
MRTLEPAGALALATKIIGLPETPFSVAKREFPPMDPSVQEPTVAMPLSLLIALAPVTDPSPLRMENVTVTPHAAWPAVLVIFTDGGTGTANPATAV